MNVFAFAHGGVPRVALAATLLALGASQASADSFVDFTFASNATLTFTGNKIDTVSGSFIVDTTTGSVVAGGSFTLGGPVYAGTYNINNLIGVPAGCTVACQTIVGANGPATVSMSFFSPYLTDAAVPTGGSNISSASYVNGDTSDSATGFSGVQAFAAPGPIPGAGLLSYIALGLLGLGSMGWKRLRQQTA